MAGLPKGENVTHVMRLTLPTKRLGFLLLRHGGMTLVELLVGTLLLVGGGGALLLGMQYAMAHVDYLTSYQTAMNAAQGQLNTLSATAFDTLWSTAQANPNGYRLCVGEDVNCNGVLDAGEDTDGNGLLNGTRLGIQIKNADMRNPLNPTLLDLHVAACWNARGRRLGEDLNCDGDLDPGEDTNGNGWIDSPAMVSTRIAMQ